MPDFALDVEALLNPISAASPSGDDLGYDAQFASMEQAGAGKPESQYGDKIFPAEPPDWPAVYEHASALARRTRDLRVAVWLMRCGARLRGLDGVEQALRLVHGLLDGLWDSVHPQLDAQDSNDPTMRINAIAPMAAVGAGLADLRSAALAPVRGSLTVRDVELGLGMDQPSATEVAPTEAGVLQALQDTLARHPEIAESATAAHRSAAAVATLLIARVGTDRAPDLEPLTKLLKAVTSAVARAQGADSPSTATGSISAGATHSSAASGIRTRADAVRELERVCSWLERNEPSNPAPLLIRRAQRLMNKSFLDIVRDLAPEGVNQVELIAGPQTPT
jgi:type VI secretion system protein ImpA